MRIIEENDYMTIQPNINIKKINNLKADEKKSYLYLTSCYYNLLELFLIKSTDIKVFDDKIENSNLGFELIEDDKKDFYQFYGGEKLKYYYIRNNINIDALNEVEKKEFLTIIKNLNGILTDEALGFIKKTMSKVIIEDWFDTLINYGPTSEQFFALNGSLVIGIRYDEFSQTINEIDWEEMHDKQDIFLLQNNALLEKNIEEKLNINCNVIRYNEFSVKKKNNISNEITKKH